MKENVFSRATKGYSLVVPISKCFQGSGKWWLVRDRLAGKLVCRPWRYFFGINAMQLRLEGSYARMNSLYYFVSDCIKCACLNDDFHLDRESKRVLPLAFEH